MRSVEKNIMKRKDALRNKVEVLLSQAQKKGLTNIQIRHVFNSNSATKKSVVEKQRCERKSSGFLHVFPHGNTLIYALLYTVVVISAIFIGAALQGDDMPICAVNNSDFSREFARPLVRCDFCRDLQSVPEEENIDREHFLRDFAYTSRPILIKGATKNWTAPSVFNYRFIKDLFLKTGGLGKFKGCEYLPYASGYGTLQELFTNMPEDVGEGKGKPWYIGWHICWEEMRRELSKYYQRPTFLPEGFTTSPSDYMFMGVAGKGAVLHLDTVQRPTWQAQITGKKTWRLVPPTECESVCRRLNVTVDKGDIIVLDTNLWFHSTHVHPGEVSIAIGKEFD